MSSTTLTGEFSPKYPLDLATAKPKDFEEMKRKFDAWISAEPPIGQVPITTGWHDITPALAQELLRRNFPGTNRKADFATVLYYADQMKRGDWVPTGQAILFSEDKLIDAQHRLLAGLLSGVTFRSFVVTDVPPHPTLFAFIDNAKARNPAAALQTAGFNGMSALISSVIKIGESMRLKLYTPTSATTLPRMAPVDYLRVMDRYPNAQLAVRSAASDWAEAVSYVQRKDVVAYVGMRIMDIYHSQDMADDFFTELVEGGDANNQEDPITALRKVIDKDRSDKVPLKRHQLLAAIIKAFEAWRKNEPLRRRWMLQVNEDFPDFEVPEEEPSETAEAA